MLLYDLPSDKRYKVVFMRRNMQEILSSQKAMLQRLGKEDKTSDEKMAQTFTKHLRNIEAWISQQDYIDVLYIKYNDVIEQPLKHAKMVNRFLEGRLDVEKMAQSVEASLYRQRKS